MTSTSRTIKIGIVIVALAFLAIGIGVGYTAAPVSSSNISSQQSMTQVSTINALLSGAYDGVLPCGEMMMLDGVVYNVKTDGKAYIINDTTTTPFAAVTFFEPQTSESISNMNYTELMEYVDRQLPTDNIFYAIKLEGSFEYMKTRSVPRQQKPYPPLVEVVEHQAIFEFENVSGTVVGFRCPPYVQGINMPEYHLHFLTEDKEAGGHILEMRIKECKLSIEYIYDFRMLLPKEGMFYTTNLSDSRQGELAVVEGVQHNP